MAHIYPCIGILTHDLRALREPAVEYFLSFWQEIRSPNRCVLVNGAKSLDARPERLVLFLGFPVSWGMIDHGHLAAQGSDGWFDPVAAGEPTLGVPAAFLGVAQLPALAQAAQMASNAC